MGLEAPLALLGLLAAGIPFLVHRLRRTDPLRRVLPTFALLERAEASRKRARALTDRLLLALRVALLALAAVALSTPFVTARVPFGDGTVAATAIVLDDSMSMLRSQGGTTLLSAARRRAQEALASLPAGSEVALVLGGRPARVLLVRTDDLGAAERALDTLPESTGRATDLTEALRLALREVRGSVLAVRRIMLLSDFAPHATVRGAELSTAGVDLVVEPLGNAAPAVNAYIASVRVARKEQKEQADTLAVEIEIRATGAAPERTTVNIVQAGRPLAHGEIALHSGTGTTVLEVPRPSSSSDPAAEVRIEIDDALDADDSAAVLLTPPRAVQLLAVNGDPHPASDDDELRYLLQALALVPEDQGAVSVRNVDAEALARHDFVGTDVLVLANVPAPGPQLAERIGAFVRQGGGLVIAAGDHIVPRAYERAFAPLLPCRIAAVARARDVSFAPAAASTLLPHGALGLSRTNAHAHLVLEADVDAEILLRFADGEPVIVSGEAGEGRVSVLAATLDDGWSDLPLRPGYLPLVWGLVRDAARMSGRPAGDVEPGGAVSLAVPPGALRMEVVAPDGSRHGFDNLQGTASVAFRDTDDPGAYRVLASGRTRTLRDVPQGGFVVRAPSQESVLSPQTLPEIALEAGRKRAASATIRRPLSPWFFLACALFALAEGWLRSRRR